MKAVRRLMGLVVAGVMVGLCGTTCAKDAVSDLEPCYVVRMLDFARTAGVVKLTQTEWKALECRISQEKKAYAQAVARASKAWYDDDKNKGITFPENALAPRAILSSEWMKNWEPQGDEALASRDSTGPMDCGFYEGDSSPGRGPLRGLPTCSD
jgi:hypothetical protein